MKALFSFQSIPSFLNEYYPGLTLRPICFNEAQGTIHDYPTRNKWFILYQPLTSLEGEPLRS